MFEALESRLAGNTIHPLEYRPILAPGFANETETVEVRVEKDSAEAAKLEERIRELERELTERKSTDETRLEAARKQGREEGRASERGEQVAGLKTTADALSTALAVFKTDRDSYLSRVEHEVVRLALAIAARILHREALMDPLLLSGAVRVALGQLADTTEVRLKVPAKEHAMWSEMLRLMPSLPLRPQVIADEALTTGECLLETHLGGVDLGVRSQLAEIERGFFDLLEHRERGAGETRTVAGGPLQVAVERGPASHSVPRAATETGSANAAAAG